MTIDENRNTETPHVNVGNGDDEAVISSVSSENARIAEFRAKMAERTEEAKKKAEERLARQEYEDRYRTRLTARENKKAEEARQRRLEEELTKQAELQEEREREILEYIRREKEESEARAARTEKLFSMVDEEDRPEKNVVEDIVSENEKNEAERDCAATEKEENEIPRVSSDTETGGESGTVLHIGQKNTDAGQITYTYMPGYTYFQYPEHPAWNQQSTVQPPYQQYAGAPYFPQYPGVYPGLQSTVGNEYSDERERAIRDRDASLEKLREQKRLHEEEEISLLIEEGRKYDADAQRFRERREEILRRREEIGQCDFGVEYAGADEPMPSDDGNYADYKPSGENFSDNEKIGNDELDNLQRQKDVEEYEKYLEKKKGIKRSNSGKRDTYFSSDVGDLNGIPTEPVEYIVSTYKQEPETEPADNVYEGADALGEPISFTVDIPLDDSELKDIEEDIEKTDKASLYKKLAIYHKEERTADKKRLKLIKKLKGRKKEEKLTVYFELLGVLREMVLLSEEELLLCVFAKNKKEISRHKKFLLKNVRIYNKCINEINIFADTKIPEITANLGKNVEETRRLSLIPIVKYNGMRKEHSDESVSHTHDVPDVNDFQDEPIDMGTEYFEPIDEIPKNRKRDRRSEREDQLRFLRETEEEEARRRLDEDEEYSDGEKFSSHERKKADKDFKARLEGIKRAKERDELLVSARIKYRIAKLEAKKDICELSFSVDYKERQKNIHSLEKEISEQRSLMKKAIRCEREDNEVYYSLFVTKIGSEKIKKRRDSSQLESIKDKIELLLSQREELNERLITLYCVGEKNSPDTDKINSIRKRQVKAMHRQQRKIAKQVSKLHIPLDRKQKIFDLLNKKTELAASIEETKYKLKRTRKNPQSVRAQKREIKRSYAEMKRISADLGYMMRKANRQHANYEADRTWIRWIVGFIVVLVILGVIFYFAGDTVLPFFKNLLKGGAASWRF